MRKDPSRIFAPHTSKPAWKKSSSNLPAGRHSDEQRFRGLLYRALDREWGGWRAIVGSAAFFAIYHPALSWGPVFLLGAVNAVLFKRTERLVPAVALHAVYNAVVIWM